MLLDLSCEDIAVFKIQVYYLSGVVRPTDQETIAIGKTVCFSQLSENQACHATWGSTRVSPEGEGMGGNVGKGLHCSFLWDKTGEVG